MNLLYILAVMELFVMKGLLTFYQNNKMTEEKIPLGEIADKLNDHPFQLNTSDPEFDKEIVSVTELNNGDTINTRAGSCDIVYGNQATFSLGANSEVTLREEPDSQDLWLSLGTLRAEVNSQYAVKPFQIATPTAVSAIRGTVVNFSINESYELIIETVKGDVFVYNDEVNLELDLVGGQTVGIFYNPVNTYFIVENSADSVADEDGRNRDAPREVRLVGR